jgi:hypothetical protein
VVGVLAGPGDGDDVQASVPPRRRTIGGALLAALLLTITGRPLPAFEPPSWLNPETAPVIFIPDIETDPDSGNTFGIMPTWLQKNSQGAITRIMSSDFYRNNYFGYGIGGSIFDYLSDNTQWYVGGDIEERVERQLDTRYESGRLRQDKWSFTARVDYDRIGTPRFFGIGNNTTLQDQTNYTSEAELLELDPGYNLDPHWQIGYLFRFQNVDVFPGSLPRIASIQSRFGAAYSLGDQHELSNQLRVIYDTRDDLTAPTHGVELVGYTGYASRQGFMNASLYHSAGFDGRAYVPIDARQIVAVHTALRYELNAHQLPFWAYSTLGGETSDIGGEDTLRGYGMGRFTDRNSFVLNLELRNRIASINAGSASIDLEVTPFMDAGRVFGRPSTDPISHLHYVGGLGLRGVARPFVVGYVDIGEGSEGPAAFTGINYPF